MWAPEGYAPFPVIDLEIARIVSSATPIGFRSLADYNRRNISLSDFAWGDFFERCPSLSVCSPSGVVLRISGDVGISLREPLIDGGFASQWVYIDKKLGTVALGDIERRARAANDFLTKLEAGKDPEMAFPESLNEYQWSCLSLASGLAELVPAFSHFEGWALCCADADRPMEFLSDFGASWLNKDLSGWDDMFAEIPVPPALAAPTSGIAGSGRPRKQEKARQVYDTLFPDGHDAAGFTLKQALLAVLRAEPGVLSTTTLQRAIGKRK